MRRSSIIGMLLATIGFGAKDVTPPVNDEIPPIKVFKASSRGRRRGKKTERGRTHDAYGRRLTVKYPCNGHRP